MSGQCHRLIPKPGACVSLASSQRKKLHLRRDHIGPALAAHHCPDRFSLRDHLEQAGQHLGGGQIDRPACRACSCSLTRGTSWRTARMATPPIFPWPISSVTTSYEPGAITGLTSPPSMATPYACWCPTCMAGRVPNGYVVWSSWPRMRQVFGNNAVIICMATPGASSATPGTKLPTPQGRRVSGSPVDASTTTDHEAGLDSAPIWQGSVRHSNRRLRTSHRVDSCR